MVNFSANSIYSNAAELDSLLFQKGQQKIAKEINDFVEQLETKKGLVTLDALAKTYVQLTTCEKKLENAADQISNNDSSGVTAELVVERSRQVQDTLQNLLQIATNCQDQHRQQPFHVEKEAYLKEKEIKRKQLEKEIRRDSDKLEELYAKKTRESIYRNIVGFHQ